MNGIGGGQHDIVSTALQASPFRTFHVLGVRHTMHMRIPSNSFVLSRLLALKHEDGNRKAKESDISRYHMSQQPGQLLSVWLQMHELSFTLKS